MKKPPLVVYAVDVGSIAKRKFAWSRLSASALAQEMGTDANLLVSCVCSDLQTGERAALGFECPLFVPVDHDPRVIPRQRAVDQGMPWCAGAGATAMATGLVEMCYVLRGIRSGADANGVTVEVTLDPAEFLGGRANLLLWEAFVTGAAKAASDAGDAGIAARTFLAQQASGNLVCAAEDGCTVFSLVGAAAIWSGLSRDLDLMSQPCVVVKPGR